MIETTDRRFGTGGLSLCELCETVFADAPIERRVSDRRAADRQGSPVEYRRRLA
jgi:hypothetical protein